MGDRAQALRALLEAVELLRRDLVGFAPGAPVYYVYNPLEYAAAPYHEYLRRFAVPPRAVRERVLLLGMNPGPWGMAQTGVPFGAVSRVRDWLGLEGSVGRPEVEHPKRRVEGFACKREEVSGDRLWGWAQRAFGTPQAFFRRFFVWNYCPLMFLDEAGRNLTPDRLRATELARLIAPCDAALRAVVAALGRPVVVGVGDFAAVRAREVLQGSGLRVGKILHPSPASPAANRGWSMQAAAQLRELGVEIPADPGVETRSTQSGRTSAR
ncbi:MAG TPA: uracil-DNA glycosylase family protein [Thermoanaerobaculia bacterium]|nr:uracil-DNA glycosylase family protein [Thermoanaerobaculia bacterium]